MNINSQINLWEQSRSASSTTNWSLLLQCLQQLILEEKVLTQNQSTPTLTEAIALSESAAQRTQLQNWAMDVFTFGDFHQRWDVAKLLPQLGTSVIASLIEILADEDAEEELRWFAVRSLGKFNHPQAIAALVELLKTSEVEDEKAMAAAALAEIGTSAIAVITELLAEENTRLLAVRSLSHIRHKETITPLLSIVQDPQREIRAAAIEALSSFHNPQIPPVLLAALNDIAPSVRREAVIGLSFRSDLREELDLIQQLLPRLYDFNLDVCVAAAIALGRLGTDTAATALFQVLQSPHTPVALQIEIIRALGRVETETSLKYLHSCLDQLTSVTLCQEIVTVLGRVEQPELRTKAAEFLIELLQSHHQTTQHASIKQAIALSLGQLSQSQALEPLIELLADPDTAVRLHAIAALKNLAPETAHKHLQQLAVNTSIAPELKQGVAIALQEWSIAVVSG